MAHARQVAGSLQRATLDQPAHTPCVEHIWNSRRTFGIQRHRHAHDIGDFAELTATEGKQLLIDPRDVLVGQRCDAVPLLAGEVRVAWNQAAYSFNSAMKRSRGSTPARLQYQ